MDFLIIKFLFFQECVKNVAKVFKFTRHPLVPVRIPTYLRFMLAISDKPIQRP